MTDTRTSPALVLAAYPDLTATTVRLHVGADHLVCESVMHATHGRSRRSVDAVDVFTIVAGRIARKDTYLDTAALAGAG